MPATHVDHVHADAIANLSQDDVASHFPEVFQACQRQAREDGPFSTYGALKFLRDHVAEQARLDARTLLGLVAQAGGLRGDLNLRPENAARMEGLILAQAGGEPAMEPPKRMRL